MGALRVALVEEEPLYRDLLRIALQHAHGQVEIVAAAENAETGLRQALAQHPDVIVSDIIFGTGMTGLDLGVEVRRRYPGTGIVLLSDRVCLTQFQLVVQRGTAGWSYLLRRFTPDVATLVRAIQGTAQGLVVLDSQLNHSLAPRLGSRLASLTSRELEVLRLMAEGYSNTALAAHLFISGKSVESHITSLYHKLGIQSDDPTVHGRVKAVRIYLEESQLGPPGWAPPPGQA